jgi:hypothetical protein
MVREGVAGSSPAEGLGGKPRYIAERGGLSAEGTDAVHARCEPPS